MSQPLTSYAISIMDIPPDFKDVLELFNAHHVEYIIVGAYALAFHGVPRSTGDIDLLVQPTEENATRILKALEAFGFTFPNLTVADFQNPDSVVQLGVPPVRVDILPSLTGVSWEEADAGKARGLYGGVEVCYLGRAEYVKNKRACGRKKDLADLEALGEE